MEMTSSESSSSFVGEEDEQDGQLYRLIYGLSTTHDKEEKEMLQVPPRDDSEEDKALHSATQAQEQKEETGNRFLVRFSEDDDAAEPDMGVSNNIQVIPVLETNREVKPWMKVGANISDYFNYGFDEESWNTYRKKQSKLRADNKKLYSKIKAQRRHKRREMKESCSACPSSGSPSKQVARPSSATTDDVGGQPGPSSRVKEHHCLRDEKSTTQVVTDMPPKEDGFSFFKLPPPPTFLFRRGPTALSSNATLESGRNLDDASTSLFPCSSGLSSLIPGMMFSSARLNEYTTALAGIHRNRSRDVSHDKDSKGGRERNRESCSSSHNSGEKRMRHRDAAEPGKRKSRHRYQREGRQKTPCSSSKSSRSKRDGGEDKVSQSRPKHKKAKRERRKGAGRTEKKKRQRTN